MKKIKILHANIQGQPAFSEFNLNESDLLFAKAKKMICEKIKTIASDEIVFYSLSKNCMVREFDKVGKYTIGRDGDEFQLYLISDLLKAFLNSKQPATNVSNNQNFDDELSKMKEKYKKIDEENKKLQAESLIQIEKYENKIIILSKEIGSLKNEIQSLKQSHEEKIQMEDEQKQKILQQFKEEMNRVKQLQLEQIKFNSQISELQFKIKEQELDKKEFQTHIDQLNTTIEFQKNQILTSQRGTQTNEQKQKLLQEQFENLKEKQKNIQLQHEIEKLQLIISSNQEEMQVMRSNSECQYKLYQRQVETIHEKCKIFEKKLKEIQIEKKSAEKELESILNENHRLTLQINLLKYEKDNEIKKNNELLTDIELQKNNYDSFSKNKERYIEQLISQDNQLKAQQEVYQIEIFDLQKQLRQSKIKIEQDDAEIQQNKKKIIELENMIKKLNEDIVKLQKNHNEAIQKLQQELDDETERTKNEQFKKDQLTKRIKQNQIRKIGNAKFIGASEALYTTFKNPSKFLENENVMTDIITAQVETLQVDQEKAIEKLTELQDSDLTDLITSETLGNWTFRKSISSNGEGTKRKAFLAQVTQCDDEKFLNKIIIIKELSGFEKISTLQKAYYVAQNQLIARVLAQQFLEKFKGSIAPCRFDYPKPILIKSETCYYIGELLYKGFFNKFNGEGDLDKKNDIICEFFNAFSLFTYRETKEMLMITNIQGMVSKNGTYILCDPIISSPEGILGEEDLAEPHILSFIDQKTKNPDRNCIKYLQKINVTY